MNKNKKRLPGNGANEQPLSQNASANAALSNKTLAHDHLPADASVEDILSSLEEVALDLSVSAGAADARRQKQEAVQKVEMERSGANDSAEAAPPEEMPAKEENNAAETEIPTTEAEASASASEVMAEKGVSKEGAEGTISAEEPESMAQEQTVSADTASDNVQLLPQNQAGIAEEKNIGEPLESAVEIKKKIVFPFFREKKQAGEKAEVKPDETEGMSLVERAKYHAKMRRREQTRLRRESARRGTGAEPYHPMTMMDIRFTLIRLAVAVVFLALGLVLKGVNETVAFVMYLIAFIITVVPIAVTVAHNFTHGKYFDEHLLVFVASFGAFLLGMRVEASLVLILYDVGKVVSDLVLCSTHKSLSEQIYEIPEKAFVVNMQGEEKETLTSEVKVGDFVLVRSGEYIPMDGVVLRGEGMVDDSTLTGNSEVVPVTKNDKVLAGSFYTGSLLLMQVTASAEDCAVSQIMQMKSDSGERKASLEDSVQHGSAHIISVVVVIAILLSVIPPLFNSETPIAQWVYRALTILILCSPTALVVSVPLSFLGGDGRLSQKGIHVKGNKTIEKMAELRMAVFDKTGTLTEGKLQVKEIQATRDFTQESCLALAAAAEQLSSHPVARAIVAAYQSVPQKISEFEEFPGRGVRARIGNRSLLVGNRRLMVSRGVKGVPDIQGTVVYIAYEGEYAGVIVLEDTVRPEAADAITGLKGQGVLRTVILTGDTEMPTQKTAEAVGIDTVHFGLVPEEKSSKMEFLLRTIPTDGTAAYVGDGINDLEELKLADIGVVMGINGTPKSADAANVLIMSNRLTRLSEAVRICRKTHNVALQNMVLVLGVKVVLALLTVLGVTNMWQAVATDVLLAVLTLLNAARVLGIK